MNPFRRLLPRLGAYRASIALNTVFNLLSVVFSLFSVGLIIPALQVIFGKSPSELASASANGNAWLVEIQHRFYASMAHYTELHGQTGALTFTALWVVVVFFLKNAFHYLALYTVAPLRNGISRDLRKDLHNKILSLPLGYYNEQRKGDLMSRMSGDLKEIEHAVVVLIETVFREPIMLLGSLAVLFWMSPSLTLFVLLLLPIASLVVTRIGKSLRRSTSLAQNRMGDLLSLAEESISGLRVIKAFNAERSKSAHFDRANEDHFRLMNRVLRKGDLASPISEILGSMVMAAVIWFGGREVLHSDHFKLEQFIAYILFFYQMQAPAKALSRASYQVQKGRASAERIFEVLDAQNPIAQKPEAFDPVDFSDRIRFRAVRFGYQAERDVLSGIDFELIKGRTVALVGQSGSGKTTIANLLPRFYDVTGGSIELDGRDLRDLTVDGLRRLMGMVNQESILFNDTVRNNIALGKPEASIDEVIQAAKVAHAHEFIEKLPKAYDTPIGDGGMMLSGGQRQRLAIARAVLKNPPILVLDEATSALDTESERWVQDALIGLMKNRTSLVIAHRLSTVQHADLILVLDSGQIAERGTHSELLAKGGIYARLIELQTFSES